MYVHVHVHVLVYTTGMIDHLIHVAVGPTACTYMYMYMYMYLCTGMIDDLIHVDVGPTACTYMYSTCLYFAVVKELLEYILDLKLCCTTPPGTRLSVCVIISVRE